MAAGPLAERPRASVARPPRPLVLALAVALLAVAVVVRVRWAGHASPDFHFYLSRWWAHLDSRGFDGLGVVFADYAPPYLYLLYLGTLTGVDALTGVKIISALGDLALAGSVILLLRRFLRTDLALLGGAVLLLVPGVVLNSAVWGQCDALYTSLLVGSVWALTGGRDRLAWVLWGAAFAIKLQAAFLLPLLGLLWLVRFRRAWWAPVLAPLVVLVSWLPCLVAGRSFDSLLDVYRGQAGQLTFLSHAPNPWVLVPRAELAIPGRADHLESLALLTTAVVLGVVGLVALARRRPWTPERVVAAAAFVLLAAPTLLPHIRERYMYPGQILTYVAALALGRRRWWMFVLLFAVSGLVYLDQLFPKDFYAIWPRYLDPFRIAAEPVLFVLAFLAADTMALGRGPRRADPVDDARP